MSRDLKYYLDLPYEIHVETDFDEGKRVYYAYISELGKHACYGKGDTIQAAVRELEATKKTVISYYLEKGVPIPEPHPKSEDELPSGNFVVRTSPLIHRQLIEQANRLGISMNLYVNQLLAQHLQSEDIKACVERLTTVLGKMEKTCEDLQHFRSWYGEIREERQVRAPTKRARIR